MKRRFILYVALLVVACAGTVSAGQFPVVDKVAQKLVMKYQNSSCDQLWQERAQKQGKPKSAREQEVVQILRNNPPVRTEFINQVAAPIVNKMFDCGMIP